MLMMTFCIAVLAVAYLFLIIDHRKKRKKIDSIGKFLTIFLYKRGNLDSFQEKRLQYDLINEAIEENEIETGATVEEFKEKMIEKVKSVYAEESHFDNKNLSDIIDAGALTRDVHEDKRSEFKSKKELYRQCEWFFDSADIFNGNDFEYDVEQEGVFPPPKIVLKFKNKHLIKIDHIK
jgi:hypothetical protein